MDIQKLKQLRVAEPFKPFNLVMADGKRLPVERAAYLAIAPNGRRLAYSRISGGVDFLIIDEVQDAVVDENLATPWKRSRQ